MNTADNATGLSNAIYPLYISTPPPGYHSPRKSTVDLTRILIRKASPRPISSASPSMANLIDMPVVHWVSRVRIEWADQSIDLESDPRTDPTRPVDASTPYNLRSSGRVVGDRSRIALGGELSVPVLDSVKLQLAARYENDDITEVDDAITYNRVLSVSNRQIAGAWCICHQLPRADMPLVFAEGAAGSTGAVDQLACRTSVPRRRSAAHPAMRVMSTATPCRTPPWQSGPEGRGRRIHQFGFV